MYIFSHEINSLWVSNKFIKIGNQKRKDGDKNCNKHGTVFWPISSNFREYEKCIIPTLFFLVLLDLLE